MITLLTHGESLIIFGIMFIFSAAGLVFLSKQNSVQLERLDGKTDKVIDNQVHLNSKVDILQHDSETNTQLLKDLNNSRYDADKRLYDVDKRLNLVEKYLTDKRAS